MCKILLVEDESIEREALRMIINEYPGNISIVGEAGNSDEALAIIDSQEIDLIFMDIKIPGISGLEVSKYVKNKYPDCSIVITTAHDEFEFAHTAIKIHVDDFLLKPVRKEKIIEAIGKYGKLKSPAKNSRLDIFIEEISNDILENNYSDAVAKSRELIDFIYVDNKDNLNKQWEATKESVDRIRKIVEKLLFDNYSKIDVKVSTLKNNHNIYTNKYTVTYSSIEYINSIFSEILLKAKGFSGDVNDIATYININIKKNISLEEISTNYNVSPYYMSKLFKKEMGINFVEYVSMKKIEMAKELLEFTDEMSVNIALDLGFSESNYFSKVFKKTVGMSPSKYRSIKKAG